MSGRSLFAIMRRFIFAKSLVLREDYAMRRRKMDDKYGPPWPPSSSTTGRTAPSSMLCCGKPANEQNRGANRHVPTQVSFDSIMDQPFWMFRN
jgi:hypothetical protein